ncbi:MAG: flagellar basal body-associated protein FliL [Psychromonas sp.]|nr:flagellar basal body-associated protein FliL [Psychromonas sp.]
MFKRLALLLFLTSCVVLPSYAAEEQANAAQEQAKDDQPQDKINADYQYFVLEPDIIANYLSSGKRVGYIRVKVELLVKSKQDLKILDKHEPLIRDQIIDVLSSQQADVIKSAGQRENIRKQCITAVNTALKSETNVQPVKQLIFTKFLYQ